MFVARQGDVLLVEVPSVPSGSIEHRRSGAPIVLALGEVTGHSHQVKEIEVRYFTAPDGSLLMTSDEPYTLVHDEHAPITIPAGIIVQKIGQFEYDPTADVRRQVLD